MPRVADTVTILPVDEPGELFRHYPGQTDPQPCVLSISLTTGTLTATYEGEISGTPMHVAYGHTMWLRIPCLTAKAANNLLEQAKPYAERILAGSIFEWDGNNIVAVHNATAKGAIEAVEALCDREDFGTGDLVYGIDAGDYYTNISSSEAVSQFELTADTTDAEIAEKARKAEEEAATEGEAGYTVLSDVEMYLTDLREDLRQAERDALAKVGQLIAEETDRFDEQIAPLRADRDARIRRVYAWDADTDRAIGELARLSHTSIGKIAKADQSA